MRWALDGVWMQRIALAASLGLLLGLPASAAGAKDVPKLTGRVVDDGEMLSAGARQRIADELAALERQTGDQVVVLTVASLEGEPVEDFSVRVAHAWRLGQKGKDTGVVLLVSRGDHQMRIEVGYGLEGRLTDLQSREILDQQVKPRFRGGDFDGGVEAGVAAIAKALGGTEVPATPAALPRPAGTHNAIPVVQRLIVGALFCLVIGTFSVIAVVLRGPQSWFLYVFLVPFYATFPFFLFGPLAAAVLVGGWLVVFPLVKLLRRNAPPPKPRKPGQPHKGGFFDGASVSTGSGWTSSSFSSSDSSSSSSGGDSFSGGGGDFGGGGASDSW